MAVNYTPEQKECVECLIGPVDVSAGAGSGKTFTLTQRIAHALVTPNTGIDSIDQICAITFTEKAAAELKGRVRSTLRAQGLFEQAGKVDDAWISTIHGMCSRILRASALELGLDPKFQVLSDRESKALLEDCVDLVLERQKAGKGADYALLLREYPFASTGFEASLSDLLSSMLDAASGLPGGLDDLHVCQRQELPSVLARKLLIAYEDLHGQYLQIKSGKLSDQAMQHISQATVALQAFLESGSQDPEAFAATLDDCAVVRKLGTAAQKQACEEYREVHYSVLATSAMQRGGVLLDQLIGLAGEVQAEFDLAKRQSARLDNNDLIRQTLRALDLPQIHNRYCNKFRLVMVDEFQDTDSLQIAIVKHLCGPNMRYLCTVGDAQQSIYGFRGADVAVYRAHQNSLDDPALAQGGANPTKLMLSRNFRSHGDVLAFVKKVCQQPQVFGSGFLDLSAAYDGAGYKARGPRVQLELVHTLPGSKAKSVHVRTTQAQRVAQYFKRMREEGHVLSDMVLLLGSTTYANLYAQAIRDLGYDCVIAGGSLFSRAPEVQVAATLLGAVANPRDGRLIYQALSSPAFALSAADLLDLGTGLDPQTQRVEKRSLVRGLHGISRQMGEGAAFSPALEHAVRVMAKAQLSLRACPVHQVLLNVLLDSGWIARLQARGAEGAAVLGNLMKAVRMVRQLEEESTLGPVGLALEFQAMVEDGLKEPPGALNAQGQDAVRIMTIHASKGLEFPIVALAEFDRTYREGALVTRKVDGKTFVSLKPTARKSSKEGDALKAVREQADLWRGEEAVSAEKLEQADAAVFRGLLVTTAAEAELAEAQRLFYVGATRAKEALCVFMSVKPSKSNPEGPYMGLVGNIRSALFGAQEFPLQSVDVDYGGSASAAFTVTQVSDPADAEADLTEEPSQDEALAALLNAEPEQVLLPAVTPLRVPNAQVNAKADSGLFSYSSIAVAGHAEGDDASFGAVESVDLLESLGAGDLQQLGAGKEDLLHQAGLDQDALAQRVAAACKPVLFLGEEQEEGPDAFAAGPTADADKATDLGSALHRLCQLAALAGPEAAREHVAAACRTYGVKDAQRLVRALERWLGSALYARTREYAHVQPELPFCLDLGGADSADQQRSGVLQGEIDLLCAQGPATQPGATALVVDYKTGGHAGEQAVQLQEKHALQAQCYALAVLTSGYESVELVFARVEQEDPTGKDALQTVCYAFTQADVPDLRRIVRDQALRAGAL